MTVDCCYFCQLLLLRLFMILWVIVAFVTGDSSFPLVPPTPVDCFLQILLIVLLCCCHRPLHCHPHGCHGCCQHQLLLIFYAAAIFCCHFASASCCFFMVCYYHHQLLFFHLCLVVTAVVATK